MKPALKSIPIADIVVPETPMRRLGDIGPLAASIAANGLLNPITVTTNLRLVAGLHRLRACESLGRTHIDVIMRSLSDLDAEIAAVDENLCRTELTAAERIAQTAKRKELWEARRAEAAASNPRGSKPRKGQKKTSAATVAAKKKGGNFAKTNAKESGRSERALRQDLQIAEGIATSLLKSLHGTPLANRRRQLLALSRIEDPAVQTRVAELIVSGGATSVAAAQRLLAERESGPEVVVDSLGTEITDPDVAAAFTLLAPCLHEIGNLLHRAHRLWKQFQAEHAEPKYDRIFRGSIYRGLGHRIERDLPQLAYGIRSGAPYALCPYCHRAPSPEAASKKCTACSNGGWVDGSTYKAAPPELKVREEPRHG